MHNIKKILILIMIIIVISSISYAAISKIEKTIMLKDKEVKVTIYEDKDKKIESIAIKGNELTPNDLFTTYDKTKKEYCKDTKC